MLEPANSKTMLEKDGSIEAGSEAAVELQAMEDTFPEGGWAAWSTLCGASVVFFWVVGVRLLNFAHL